MAAAMTTGNDAQPRKVTAPAPMRVYSICRAAASLFAALRLLRRRRIRMNFQIPQISRPASRTGPTNSKRRAMTIKITSDISIEQRVPVWNKTNTASGSPPPCRHIFPPKNITSAIHGKGVVAEACLHDGIVRVWSMNIDIITDIYAYMIHRT